ncbi:response regulator transcription factor [Massilia sp. PAMC28688]|uniref:response regulator transcription factor n=1 Tax=Massilia sp. PAMC28688 TaxID=2861283 RepID=UPI001C625618|nr:response regulator transcription factor [Massilia sp. PAMC28688]QYF93779.1 response regulator transcription factor [Massilia sp. PAMC28688]
MDHLFISAGGIMLPAWREAFPQARCAAPGQLDQAASCASLAWLRLDGSTGLAGHMAALRMHCTATPVIVMSDLPDDAEAIAALGLQARGYCNSHAGAEVLLKVASVVAQGGLWIGETLMQRLLGVQHRIAVPEAARRPQWRNGLTAREIEVAELVATGMRNKEIARQLTITERTVKAHMGAVLEKLGLQDRMQLALLIGERQRA